MDGSGSGADRGGRRLASDSLGRTTNDMTDIRAEEPQDIPAIRQLHVRAFGQAEEANVVDALRANGGGLLSLVAIDAGQLVGHIIYSPARVGGLSGAALGPMAVSPEHQRRGIGTKLVEAGNAQLARLGCPVIVVVGHPEFYPRFGFRPASSYGITCRWDVPDDAFMALALDATRVAAARGLAEFRPEFGGVA
jgi:putative acetyltransferase